MTVHAFADETKRNDRFLLAVALVASRDLAATRAAMRKLRVPGETRLHFSAERDGRRRQLATAISAIPVVVNIYDAGSIRDLREARSACLRQLVVDLAELGAHRLVIEPEASMGSTDRQVLYQAVRKAGVADQLTYEHLDPEVEPLLWIPDAVAWCWTKDARWRDRVRPIVGQEWAS